MAKGPASVGPGWIGRRKLFCLQSTTYLFRERMSGSPDGSRAVPYDPDGAVSQAGSPPTKPELQACLCFSDRARASITCAAGALLATGAVSSSAMRRTSTAQPARRHEHTGLAGRLNLAWKLALVAGRADPACSILTNKSASGGKGGSWKRPSRAFALIVADWLAAGLFRTRILANVAARAMNVRAGATARVPHHFADRIKLSKRAHCHMPLGPAQGRAGGGRPLPVDAAQARVERLDQGLFRQLDDTEFNLLLIGAPAQRGRLRRP